MLISIEIKNFRGFGELQLEGLGRVNLLVGENNSGKTSMLEGITLLANPSMIKHLPGLYRANAGLVDDRFYRWLPRDADDALRATLCGITADGDKRKTLLDRRAEPAQLDEGMTRLAWDNDAITVGFAKASKALQVHAVSVQHRSPDALIDSFAEAVRAPADERQMESLLSSIDDRIRTVRLDAVHARPFIAVDVGLSERIPLSQAGQGIYRLVAIFSELLGRKPKICLIDEIENGIHYTALAKVWEGIAAAAARLDVQIFVTTHSRECLEAAHEAFAARERYDLRVIQLYRLRSGVSGRVLDRAHIEAAISDKIEVR